jgi:hypothetical protein
MIRPSKINTDNLKTGDVIIQHTESFLLKPSTWSSYIIRKVTKSKWNHSSEILIIDRYIYVIESLWGWITLTSWSKFNKNDKYIKQLRFKWFDNKFNQDKYIIKALKQLDKRYDYLWIRRIFLMICFGYWNKTSKEISMTHRRCSEFNAWMKDLSWWQSYFPKDFDKNKLFEEVLI